MSDYCPGEVLIEILSKLPAKSLLRFRCVSKSWSSHISSSDLITTHLTHSTTTSHQLLIKHFSLPSNQENYSLYSDSSATLENPLDLKCPFKPRSKTFFRLVSTCHGLLCLSDDLFGYAYTLILWNPSIRKYITLPKPRVCFDTHGPYMFSLGFGFDLNTNDYKVVRIAYLQHKPGSWEPSAGVDSLMYGTE